MRVESPEHLKCGQKKIMPWRIVIKNIHRSRNKSKRTFIPLREERFSRPAQYYQIEKWVLKDPLHSVAGQSLMILLEMVPCK